MNKKKPLPNQLQEFHIVKKDKRPIHRQDTGKQFLTNLLYMTPLGNSLKSIIPFYWNPGKSIIDVTAGDRLIWKNFPYNHVSSCGFIHWEVEFNDLEESVKAHYHVPAQEIHKQNKKWDILVCDFPFTELKNGVESFGTRARNISKDRAVGKRKRKERHFYFRNFRPLKELFPECVKPFNKAADNLIIKMVDSHKHKRLVSNVFDAELCFDCERNPESDFHLIDRIGYRGNYARRGGRFPFAQSVLSYYLIFKKDPSLR